MFTDEPTFAGVAGEKPQVVQTAVCAHFPLELHDPRAEPNGLPSSQHCLACYCFRFVSQVKGISPTENNKQNASQVEFSSARIQCQSRQLFVLQILQHVFIEFSEFYGCFAVCSASHTH